MNKKQKNKKEEQALAAAVAAAEVLAAEQVLPPDEAADAPLTEAAAEAVAEAVAESPASAPDEAPAPDVQATADTDLSRAAALLATLPPQEQAALIGALAHLCESERMREEAMARAEEEAAIAEMEGTPVFAGISARADAIRALSGAVGWLSALPLYERLAAAYYIDRGMRYGEPTKEDLLEAALSDSALGRELALQASRENARTAAALPPVQRKRGLSRAPAAVKAAPRTLKEATDEAKKFLRFYK